MEYYSAIKNNEILFHCDNMVELEIIMLGEIRQAPKDKYHLISLKCGA
jgi:hypothetical protein